MKFWKINGTGNDFIIINNIDEKIPRERLGQMARKLCERRMSIGADGLMVIERSEKGADFKMLFYNSDGSAGEMCGNGARCACRFGFENSLAGEFQRIETDAGIVTGERLSRREYKVRLNEPAVCRLDERVRVCGREFLCSYAELGKPGVPHCVVEMKNLSSCPESELRTIGKSLRSYMGYPKGANVNFYDITGENRVYERTFERGVEDFTYACGTGTGCVALVLFLKKLVSAENIRFDTKGGCLTIDITARDNKVTDIFLTGTTNVAAKGEISDEDLNI